MALEPVDGKLTCGLVRNPLGYMYRATHPGSDLSVLGDQALIKKGSEISVQLAYMLGLGLGCDSHDDAVAAEWPDSAH